MLVAEQFIKSLIRKYGKHNISTDGGTWYPQACRFLNIQHPNHSSIEKSFIERTIQYLKIEPNVLMIISLVGKTMIVSYSMS
jgi:putative transposase